MKNTIIISILLLTINCFGQVNAEKIDSITKANKKASIETDTAIKVFYDNKIENDKKPAYFLDKELVDEHILRTNKSKGN